MRLCFAYAVDNVVGMVLGYDPDHDRPVALPQHLEPADVLHVLRTTGPMMIAVILDGDSDVLPAHIQIGFGPTPFVANRDLCLRPWKAGVDQLGARPQGRYPHPLAGDRRSQVSFGD